MIIETLKYCFHYISCPKYIRELGLLSDLIGIESRYSRCKQAWSPHLEHSRRVILEAAQRLQKRERIIIFGAGSLHDVPLRELSELFTEVHLVDIFFLQGTINEIKSYPNVEFHEVDITGVLKKAYEVLANQINVLGKRRRTRIDQMHIDLVGCSIVPKHFINDEFDLVISLNLLSQLPMAIKTYSEKKLQLGIEHLTLSSFYASLITNHLSYLRAFALKGARVLLISDTEKQVCKVDGEILLTESSLEGMGEDIFSEFELIDQWTWDLAPIGELDSQYILQLQIKAFIV